MTPSFIEDFNRPAVIHNQAGIGFAGELGDRYNDLAEKHFEHALELEPDYPEARYNYALLLEEELDRPEEAEEQYLTAIEDNDGTYPKARNNYALLLENELERPEEAEEQYLTAIEDNDDSFPEAEFNLGTLLESLDRLNEAVDHIERSITIWRQRNRLDNAINDARALARIHREREAYDEALETALDAIDWCAQTDDDRLDSFVEFLVALEGDVDTDSLVCGAYRAGLRYVTAKDGSNAHRLFVLAFQQREECSGEALRCGRSAGVAIAAHAETIDRNSLGDPLADLAFDDSEVIADAMADHAETLRPPVCDCLTLLTNDPYQGTEETDAEESLRRLESNAFGRLATLAV